MIFERWQPKRRIYVLVTTLIVVLVTSLAAIALHQEKQRYRERAAIATQNIASLLDQHISDTYDKIDFALQASAQLIVGAHGLPLEADAARQFLNLQASLLPELDSIRIADRDGYVLHGRDIPTNPRVNLSDRAYFIQARTNPTLGLIVESPVFARISKKWVVVLARRLNAPDGSFAGIIYATLPTSYFEQIFSTLSLGPHGAVTIRTDELALIHRHPETKNPVGSKEVSKQLQEAVRQHPDKGEYIAETALDGIERSNAYRKIQDYPFYIIVGLSTDDYLGGWKENRLIVSGLAALVIMLTGLAALVLYFSQRRLADTLKERIQTSGELERAAEERLRLNTELQLRTTQAESANRAKSAFLANMSHEMRTPLHHISGIASLIKREPLSAKQAGYMEKLESAQHQLADVIESILEVTAIESGSVELKAHALDLPDLLQKTIAHPRELAEAKGLTLSTEIRPIPGPLAGDAASIQRALRQYLSNAVRFTSQGKIHLTVFAVAEEADSVVVRFEVKDTGIGIPEDVMPRLFTIFEQADNSSTRAFGGMGLGLAITKKIAQLMGGDAGCSSTPGEGSLFWFSVKLKKLAAQD